MFNFIDISSVLSKQKIIVFGSYQPENIKILELLVQYLVDNGLKETFLAKDLENPFQSIYKKIKKLMKDYDFCIFVFFSNGNDSVALELTSFVLSDLFEKKSSRIMVYLPYGYDYSMVKDFISEFNLNVFEYQNEFQIVSHCFNFIKRNFVN